MRRRAIFLAGAAALLPTLLASGQLGAVEPAAQTFAAPDTPLILTRTTIRALAGGRQIVVRRRYQVRIAPDGDGFRIDGQLVSAEVDAPAALRSLADLERNRQDDGLFPILLDDQGLIVSQRNAGDRSATSRAGALLISRISAQQITSSERATAGDFVSQVVRSGGESGWPRDLFSPQPGSRSEVRDVALPGGGVGELTITTEAQIDQASGRMESFSRTVLTRIEGGQRESRESWTLRPIIAETLPTSG